MEDNFATQIFDAHKTSMQSTFYKGTLASQSLINYSESKGPRNPGFPTNFNVNSDGTPTSVFSSDITSERIIFTSQSNGTHNYGITLNTHTSPQYTGHYGTSNRAYAYGDFGTLEVKLNGDTVCLANLENNFNTSLKGGNQTISSYDIGIFSNGTASFSEGYLALNKVGVFNNVSQSITGSNGFIFPNGYQGWDATVNITSKPREGYNYLELIHNISQSFTQSLNVFDWYYNDGIESASITTNENFTYEEKLDATGTPVHATHSLSGVSYFKRDTFFTVSLNNILNLANKVYPSNQLSPYTPIYTQRLSSNLTIKGDSQEQNGGKLFHRFNNLQQGTYDSTLRRGLRFHTASISLSQFGETTGPHQDNYIPTAESTASIKLEVKAVNLTNEDTIDERQGEIFEVKGVTRQIMDDSITKDRELYQKPIGRFMYQGNEFSNYVASTHHIENFNDESRRWSSASIEDVVDINRADYNVLLTDDPDYNSIQSILSTNDLQQIYSGSLRYPSGDYSGVTLPNSVNYTNAIANTANGLGDRFYYRAFKLPAGFSDSTISFKVKVFGKFTQSDIFAQGIDNSNVRIDIRLPGQFDDPFGNLGDPTVGTFWGVVNNQFSTADTTGGPNNNTPWCAYGGRDITSTDPTLSEGITFTTVTQGITPFFTDGVIVLKIRYKSGFTGYIDKIQITL